MSEITFVSPREIKNLVSKKDGSYVKPKNDEKSDIAQEKTYILDTVGTNLMETLAVDYIDAYRTYSNDIRETYDVLGIEATRQVIFNELSDVLESSSYINYHHTSLLCDRMTSNKDLVSIFRTGILNDNIGPIAKSTFEVHTEVLLDAARFAEFDHLRGVSANVMCGQNGYYGTSAFQLTLDLKEMETLGNSMNIKDSELNIDKMLAEGSGAEDGDNRDKIQMDNDISYINRKKMEVCDDNYTFF